MPDKKFHHVTLTIEDQVLRDLAVVLSLRGMCEQGGTVADAFLAKLVREVKQGHDVIRYEYKDQTRGQ